jgi:predicted transcriptional regulator of viral defense system
MDRAFSATESIEADIAIETGKLPVLAPQEFVDCVPNPEQCGGTGGCQGATAELAFNYTMSNGQISAEEYKYPARRASASSPSCPRLRLASRTSSNCPSTSTHHSSRP